MSPSLNQLPALADLIRLLPQAVNDALLRQMFEPFGTVLHTAVLYDASTSKLRRKLGCLPSSTSHFGRNVAVHSHAQA